MTRKWIRKLSVMEDPTSCLVVSVDEAKQLRRIGVRIFRMDARTISLLAPRWVAVLRFIQRQQGADSACVVAVRASILEAMAKDEELQRALVAVYDTDPKAAHVWLLDRFT